MKAIEKGFELQGQRVGGKQGVYADIESLGSEMGKLADAKDTLTNAIKTKLDTMKFSDKQQRLVLENEMAKKVEELTARKLTESMNLRNRADADRIVKWLVGAGLAGAGVKTYGITRLTEH